jgi:chorismate synthase
MLRFLDAGESHGPALTAIIEGLPAGLPLTEEDINHQLTRRQGGYGRGERMNIEKDKVSFISGVRGGLTLGSPITLQINNWDFANWAGIMTPSPEANIHQRVITRPRPGHADLAGSIKYRHQDIRNVLERASARETAARVAVGSVARRLLEELGIKIIGFVRRIGSIEIDLKDYDYCKLQGVLSQSQLLCPDVDAEERMIQQIEQTKKQGDSLGGIFEIRAYNLPLGLGSYVHYDRKLDSQLAGALMSIQAIKGVEIGDGFRAATLPGSKVHDEIFYNKELGFHHKTNGAGGIEGGMTNGSTVVVRAAMKPIPTLYKPLNSVDLVSKEPIEATVERSDVCAVPAATVVGEAVVAWELSVAMLQKFPSDNLYELQQAVENYREYIRQV